MSTQPVFVWVVMPDRESQLDAEPYVFEDESSARAFARLRGQDPDAVVTEEPLLNEAFVQDAAEARRRQ